MPPSILFVCLGNICRSPLAEAALRARAEAAGLDMLIDSAGTGDWNVGRAPDERAQAIARRHGLDISGYRARQVEPGDFNRFTHICAMDGDNLAQLRQIKPSGSTADLRLLQDWVSGREGQSIADPYYGEASGFDITWAEVDSAAQALVAQL